MAVEKRAKIDVIIPTYHPDERFDLLVTRLNQQTVKPDHIIIIRTKGERSSRTAFGKKLSQFAINVGAYKAYKNIKIVEIEKEDFDHGGTRNLGASLSDAEFMLFMTQDAVPMNPYLIERILKDFEDKNTAVVYGRQVASRNAGEIETFVRRFNYPPESCKKTMRDLSRLGIKTYFNSNTCSCYRRTVFDELGGFVSPTNFNEDMFFGAEAVRSGYAICYEARAKVMHSHKYSWMTQLRRNFDNGVSQKQYREIVGDAPAEGEGLRLVGEMTAHLAKKGRFLLIPMFYIECAFRYMGFFLGKHYELLPRFVCRRLSLNRKFWANK